MLYSAFFFRSRHIEKRTTPRRDAITAITIPAIAPAERFLGEELILISVSEVRLGLVAKVENEGVNVI